MSSGAIKTTAVKIAVSRRVHAATAGGHGQKRAASQSAAHSAAQTAANADPEAMPPAKTPQKAMHDAV